MDGRLEGLKMETDKLLRELAGVRAQLDVSAQDEEGVRLFAQFDQSMAMLPEANWNEAQSLRTFFAQLNLARQAARDLEKRSKETEDENDPRWSAGSLDAVFHFFMSEVGIRSLDVIDSNSDLAAGVWPFPE